jgi:uncharacterized protein DUF1996
LTWDYKTLTARTQQCVSLTGLRAWVAIVAVGLVALAGFAAEVGIAAKPGAPGVMALKAVNFISSCRFSHRSMDDPIVYPRNPGASHDHTFVGNTTTNASSTLRTLRVGSTTCKREGDTAGYWMPTLLLNGQPVEPRGATIYYRRRTLEPVRAFPAGLKMIAGQSHAVDPQDLSVTYWNCGAAAEVRPSAAVPTCPDARGMGLRLHVNFPSCWDGRRLDSADHQRHMAYAMRGTCPATHPVAVPAISLIYRYPTAGGPTVSLSSGGQYSAHADFFNAWRQPELRSLVDGCLNALRHCAQDI